ncbi:MAG: hypothetical protein HKP10_01695 [Kiritimatiellales bacterium]|nr:hypothetical protein [Kiritimatiellales bacterium]
MISRKSKTTDIQAEYREETIKVPAIITVVILLLVAVPLIYGIFQINKEGLRQTDVTQYTTLAATVSGNIQAVEDMLRNDATALAAIQTVQKNTSVRFIGPEDADEEIENLTFVGQSPLNVELEGIYWSPAKPLVGIGGETYRIGDSIQGYEIYKISKTRVYFRGQTGDTVIKDMYGDIREINEKM